MISRRTMIGRMALVWGGRIAVAPLLGCGDESATPAGPDGGGAGVDAGVDAGLDAAADAEPDAGPDGAADAGVDAAADAEVVDVAADGHRPGILSVPPDDLDVTVTEPMVNGARAYLAVPNRVGSFAGLVLVPDEAGLTDHLRDVARRFAKSGCVALVPDLGARTPEALLADLGAALDTLAQQPQVGTNRHGAAGFGDGATRALRFAAANPGVRAVVSYYGPTPMPPDVLATTSAAVLGQYGATDDAVNAGIPDLERVMKEAGKTFEKRLYPAAGHGFNDDTGPGYNEDAAVAAWPYTIGWMEVYLA